MKTQEERNALRVEAEALNAEPAELSEDALKRVAGGAIVSNPAVGMPREQAERIAKELDEGTYAGKWRAMTGDEFMEWWRRSNPGK